MNATLPWLDGLADAVLLLAAVGTPVAVLAIKLAANGVSLVVTATAGLVRGK